MAGRGRGEGGGGPRIKGEPEKGRIANKETRVGRRVGGERGECIKRQRRRMTAR